MIRAATLAGKLPQTRVPGPTLAARVDRDDQLEPTGTDTGSHRKRHRLCRRLESADSESSLRLSVPRPLQWQWPQCQCHWQPVPWIAVG